jgi:hypothetical protein
VSRASPPLVRIPVGVVVARRKAASQWIDFTWTPVAVLDGVPETDVWQMLHQDGDTTTFYAGSAEIELYRSETSYYRDNLATGAASLWVVMTSTEGDPPYRLVAVTADPAEGESFTESTANLVEQLPMPPPIETIVASFIAEHHVEREFVKRKRDRPESEALARRDPGQRK